MSQTEIEKRYKIIGLIGQGNYSDVYLVTHRKTKKQFALKVLNKNFIVSQNQQKNVLEQKKILSEIKHPFIIKLQATYADPIRLYFVIEYCMGGDLYSLLKKRTRLDQHQAIFYISQIVLVFQYLHSKNIVYRDLKPENVLLAQNGYIKLTDFGLSKILHKNSKAKSLCGTPQYLAPQIVKRESYGKNIDWWTLGCFIHQLITGVPPFNNEDHYQLFNQILQNEFIPKKYFSDSLKDLLKKLLTKNPQHRLGFNGSQQIKNHKWFQKINWNDLINKNKKCIYIPERNQEYQEYKKMNNQRWKQFNNLKINNNQMFKDFDSSYYDKENIEK